MDISAKINVVNLAMFATFNVNINAAISNALKNVVISVSPANKYAQRNVLIHNVQIFVKNIVIEKIVMNLVN